MARFNKLELAKRFFVDGSNCVKSADILFHDKIRGPHSQYGVLLIHGVELLLKSYLLLKNTSLKDDQEIVDKYLKKLGHKYADIYDECKKYGNEISVPLSPETPIPILAIYLYSMRHTYYEDSVGVRYIVDSETVLFDPLIFATITGYLIRPIHNILFPATPFSGDYNY